MVWGQKSVQVRRRTEEKKRVEETKVEKQSVGEKTKKRGTIGQKKIYSHQKKEKKVCVSREIVACVPSRKK